MYHEITIKQMRSKKRKRLVAAFLLLVLAVGIVFGVNSIQYGLREQGALSVRNAILDSAKQCCAVEGSYPLTLDHLEQYYGLTINHDDYVITYQAFASNVTPSVVVVPR